MVLVCVEPQEALLKAQSPAESFVNIQVVVVTCCVLLTLAGPPDYAQDVWKFHLVPYLWMAGLNGDIAVRFMNDWDGEKMS